MNKTSKKKGYLDGSQNLFASNKNCTPSIIKTSLGFPSISLPLSGIIPLNVIKEPLRLKASTFLKKNNRLSPSGFSYSTPKTTSQLRRRIHITLVWKEWLLAIIHSKFLKPMRTRIWFPSATVTFNGVIFTKHITMIWQTLHLRNYECYLNLLRYEQISSSQTLHCITLIPVKACKLVQGSPHAHHTHCHYHFWFSPRIQKLWMTLTVLKNQIVCNHST